MYKIKRVFSVLLMPCLFITPAALGYTDAEIDQMVGELKEENQELRDQVRELKGEADEDTLQQTTVQSQPSASQSSSTAASVMQTLEDNQKRFQINGFLTAGFSQSSQDIGDQNISFRENGSFESDSIVGLQTSFYLTDTTDVTIQMVARGADDWDLEAEWAFVRYRPNEQYAMRAGRLRLPVYLFSESLEVGFSYPWIRPPEEVYAIPINNYDGIDATYTLTTGNWVHSLQLFVGNEEDDTFETDIFYGGNLTSGLDFWMFRISAYTFDLEFLDTELPVDLSGVENGGDYYTFSTMYDDGTWLLITEISIFKADEPELFRDTNAGYITVGRYIGKFLPHFTFATAETTNEPPNPIPIPGVRDPSNFTGDSYTLGLRYNLSDSASAKLEWNHYRNLDNTAGIWNSLRYTFPSEARGVDDIDIVSIVLDVVF